MPSRRFRALYGRYPDLPGLIAVDRAPMPCVISAAPTTVRLPNGDWLWPDYVADFLTDGLLDANYNYTERFFGNDLVVGHRHRFSAHLAVPVGLEIGAEATVAWFPTVPGCFSYGRTTIDALRGVADAMARHARWVAGHATPSGPVCPTDSPSPAGDGTAEEWPAPFPTIVERVHAIMDDVIEIGATFRADFLRVTPLEWQRALMAMEFSRRDLFRAIRQIPAHLWAVRPDDDTWSVQDIIQHVATVEAFFVACWRPDANVEPHDDQPPLVRMALVRDHVRDVIRRHATSDHIGEWHGETWTLRKLLRKLVWHERVHTAQINRLSATFQTATTTPHRCHGQRDRA